MASVEMRATKGILFVVIADRKGTVMAEYSRVRQATIGMNAKRVLKSLPNKNVDKQSYSFNDMQYNLVVDSMGHTIMCVTDNNYQRVRCFQFLSDCKMKYVACDRNTALFNTELSALSEYYSDPQNDKLQSLKEDIDQVKGVMIENMDKVLDRGERIDTVVDKTQTLKEKSHDFKNNSRELRRRLVCKRIMCWVGICIILLLVVLILLLFFCSEDGFNFDKCFGSSKKE